MVLCHSEHTEEYLLKANCCDSLTELKVTSKIKKATIQDNGL